MKGLFGRGGPFIQCSPLQSCKATTTAMNTAPWKRIAISGTLPVVKQRVLCYFLRFVLSPQQSARMEETTPIFLATSSRYDDSDGIARFGNPCKQGKYRVTFSCQSIHRSPTFICCLSEIQASKVSNSPFLDRKKQAKNLKYYLCALQRSFSSRESQQKETQNATKTHRTIKELKIGSSH